MVWKWFHRVQEGLYLNKCCQIQPKKKFLEQNFKVQSLELMGEKHNFICLNLKPQNLLNVPNSHLPAWKKYTSTILFPLYVIHATNFKIYIHDTLSPATVGRVGCSIMYSCIFFSMLRMSGSEKTYCTRSYIHTRGTPKTKTRPKPSIFRAHVHFHIHSGRWEAYSSICKARIMRFSLCFL
jgi:hypothetical protein